MFAASGHEADAARRASAARPRDQILKGLAEDGPLVVLTSHTPASY